MDRLAETVMLTFVVESIDPVDACALVVASKEKEVFRVLDFVR